MQQANQFFQTQLDKVNAMKTNQTIQSYDVQRPYLVLFCALMLGVLTSGLIR